MKIAILSDIHGNKAALDAVFEDIQKNTVDHIIVLGDLTGFTGENNDVLEIIKSKCGFIIKGNEDLYLQNNHELFGYDQFLVPYLMKKSISEINNNYIKSLPEQISLIFNSEFSVRCTHGSPFKINEHIDEMDEKTQINCLNKINEHILLCGHTHKQWYKSIQEKIIINPGSVGLTYSGDKTAQYAMVIVNSNNIQIEIKKIAYNFELFKKKCDLDIPWIRLCVRGMEDGIFYTNKFLEEAKSRTKEWPIPNEIWNNLFKEWCNTKII